MTAPDPIARKRASKKRWAQQNKDRVNASARARRLRDPEHFKQQTRRYCEKDPVRRVLNTAKSGAKKRGMPFTLTREDIERVWPANNRCPVFGIELRWRDCRGSSPSLDRIDNRFGYLPGNIAIISDRANILKRDVVDPNELRKVADWLERELQR